MRKAGFINKLLYETRIKKKETLRLAAIHLRISTLRLKMIEVGYLKVSKKLQPRFIKHYKLDEDFFTKNSDYVKDISEYNPENEATFGEQTAKFYTKKGIKYGSIICSTIFLGVMIFGIVYGRKQYFNPQSAWTENFRKFNNGVKQYGEKSKSVVLLDNVYTIKGDEITAYEETSKHIVTCSSNVSVYEKESNSASLEINSINVVTDPSSSFKYKIEYNFFCYNNKKLVYSSLSNLDKTLIDGLSITYALGIIDSTGNFTLQPFDYYIGLTRHKAEVSSDVYNKAKDVFSRYIVLTYDSFNTGLLKRERDLGHNLGYTNINDLINDTQKVSRCYVFNFRFGCIASIIGGVMFVISIVLLFISLYSKNYLKHLNDVNNSPGNIKKIVVERDFDSRREIANDLAISPVLPEFSLKGIGLIIIFLASFSLFASVSIFFNKSFLGMTNVDALKQFSSTFLIAGTTLLFFIKLDVYSKKSYRDLLLNISLLFLGGLAYYIIEVTLFSALVNKGDMFSLLLSILNTFIPGNIVWNLMLYSIIFLFLFTTPKRIEANPSKILMYRLCSLIPTAILAFAFVYKSILEKQIVSPYWITFMFYTKGMIITLFAILYMYSLYFCKLYHTFKYGAENAEIVFNSRRFSFIKNIIACSIIVILTLIDLFAKYNLSSNEFGLGTSWPIIVLVPFILLYRPHIGNRNKTWDRIYLILYGICFTWGYIATILTVVQYMDFSDLVIILF